MSGRIQPPGIVRRIFVVGVPRSGTTLVQSLLAAHSTLTSFTESHFFDRHFTQFSGFSTPLLTRNPLPKLREFLAENGEQPALADWFEKRPSLRIKPRLPLQSRLVAQRLLRVLDEVALGRDKVGWIEKTPRHLRYIPFLEALCAGVARTDFVHVIRDGLEVVASLHKASQSWERPYDLRSCVRRCNQDLLFSLGRGGGRNDHFLSYEQLTSQPEATVRRLLSALDLGWEPEILEKFSAASERLVTGKEQWKMNVGRPIRPSATSGSTLSQSQREWVRGRLNRAVYDQLVARASELGEPKGGDS